MDEGLSPGIAPLWMTIVGIALFFGVVFYRMWEDRH